MHIRQTTKTHTKTWDNEFDSMPDAKILYRNNLAVSSTLLAALYPSTLGKERSSMHVRQIRQITKTLTLKQALESLHNGHKGAKEILLKIFVHSKNPLQVYAFLFFLDEVGIYGKNIERLFELLDCKHDSLYEFVDAYTANVISKEQIRLTLLGAEVLEVNELINEINNPRRKLT